MMSHESRSVRCRGRRRAGRSIALAAGALSAVLLSACAADAPAASGGGSDALIEISVVATPVKFEPLYYAQESGVFEEHGLTVEIKPAGAADTAIAQLISGEVQFAGTSGVATATAVSQDIPVQIVVGNFNSRPSSDSGVVVPEGSEAQSLADLTGKKVGINGLRNTTELMVSAGIDFEGGDSTQTQFVELPYTSMEDALRRGTVDAVFTVSPYYNVSEGSGLREIINPVTQAGGELDGMASVAWAAAEAYIASNEDVVNRFIASMEQAVAYLNDNPAVAKALTIAHSEQDPDVVNAQEFIPYASALNVAANEATVAAMNRYGFIDSAPAADQYVSALAPRE